MKRLSCHNPWINWINWINYRIIKRLTGPRTAQQQFFVRTFLPAALLAAALTAAPAQAASAAEKSQKQTPDSLHVISDQMIAEQGKSTVEFIGHVKATQQDSELLADSVKVFFRPDSDKASAHLKKPADGNDSSIEKIVATGHVEYTAGDRKAYADKAVYTATDQVLVLTGKAPRMLTGKSWVTGKKITLFRTEERVMVESEGSNRVQAYFDAQDQQQGKNQDRNPSKD